MPIDISYGLDPYAASAAAFGGAAGVAQREASQFGAQMNMRDRHFYDGMANDRGMMILRHQLGQIATQQDTAARMEYGRMQQAAQMQELERRNQLERENTEWTYTKEQENKQKQYQKELETVDQLRQSGEFDDYQARDARFKIHEKLLNIKPIARPKENPLEQYPVVSKVADDGTERKYHIVPGRNGKPEYVPQDPTELDPKTAAKREADAEKAKIAAEKEQYDREQKAADAIMRREELAMKRYELLTKPVPNDDGIGSTPRMSHADAMEASGLSEFVKTKPKAETPPAAAQGPPALPPIPPGPLPQMNSREEALRLPPRTWFLDSQGTKRFRP